MLRPEIERRIRRLMRYYENACREYNREYRLLDDVLYGLCRKMPHHAQKGEVNAKVGIIGRTYATGIERKIPKPRKDTPGGSMSKLTAFLYKKRKEVKALLSKVEAIREPLSLEKLKTIIEIHGKLTEMISKITHGGQATRSTEMIRKITHGGQATRSFVSKYMHFHCPAVPLFDRVANSALPKFCRWDKKRCPIKKRPANADEIYCKYAMRFWTLYERLRKEKAHVKVKLLDFYLRHGRKFVNTRHRKQTRKKKRKV